MTTEENISSINPEENVSPDSTERQSGFAWKIGTRQVVYIALGIALYAILNIIFNIIPLPNAGGGAIVLRPGIVIPLLFGVLFGPIVGLFVGGVGNIISDLISFQSFYWNWDIGNALIGFVAGLAVLVTVGRYRKTRALVIAEIASLLSIIIGIGFAAYTDIWVSKISLAAANSEFVIAGISDTINGLILLPIVIVAYNAVVRSRGRS